MRRELAYYDLEPGVAALIDGQDAAFVRRLQANEDAAYDELVRSYNASIYHVAFRMLGDAAEASDAVQDIFLKVFRNIGSFRGDASLKTWVFRIGISEILNRLRWWKRRHRLSTVSVDDDCSGNGSSIHLRDSAPSPQERLESREQEIAIQQALGRLSSDHRSIVVLRDIEGFSYIEIAAVLGISVGTVKSRLARARADMKKSLIRYLSIQRV
jgi:RNA polymerase sigma-70 factor (ECF subfamily)